MYTYFQRLFFIALFSFISVISVLAQDRIITVPKPVPGAPFEVNDSEDLFGKAYRWFHEGEVELAADSLKKLIGLTGFKLNEANYYVVVANFTDKMSPIGLIHAGSSFEDTRLYGLTADTLFYVFISKRKNAESFLSTTLTAKSSPSQQNLVSFLSLFLPIPTIPGVLGGPQTVWIDVRRFEIPPKFQKNADISMIVKKELGAEDFLATAVFDNTALEHWSFGVATAVTSVDDVDFLIGSDGTIIVRPKPKGDFAAFGVVNYHFKAVDTKAPTIASSFHILAGLRLDNDIEPIVGLGFGFPIPVVELHFFAGVSIEFTNELKSDFFIGQRIDSDVDPFNLNVRVRPRYGIEIKFP
ncbi:MAG: hypothetical protein ACE5HO_11040 [bacterium]